MSIVDDVLTLANEHRETWREKSDRYWFLGLLEEVIELGLKDRIIGD